MASTVSAEVVLLQPVAVLVNVNVTGPAATAVTTPASVTVAKDGLLLTHVPPLVGDNMVEVLPKQIKLVFKLTIGNAFTVNATAGLDVTGDEHVPLTTTSNVAPFSDTPGLVIVKVEVVTLL